ncbi:peptidase inhibitor family I36 protein [Nonomuraea sp. NPDC052129]|uniref:peptidase inhibitor family I36 protein n=1 Tax=Nonomuraea sp. NPDC052129 TaxID=3154651 RepID=UPI003417E5B6
MRNKIMRVVVAATALTTLLGVGSTAEAGTNDLGPCNYDLCLYEHDDFEGGMTLGVDFGIGPKCHNMHEFDNKASSMKNTSKKRVLFYDRANCAGASGYAAKPRSEDKDLTNNGFDNKTSSIKGISQ